MKKLFVLVCLLVLPFIFSQKIFASATNPTPDENGAALDNYENNGQTTSPVHVFTVKDSENYYLSCRGIGIGCHNCAANPNQQCKESFDQSVLGRTTQTIAYLYQNKPADTSQFIAYYSQKLGIAKPAYAQGIGFSGLTPLMSLWRAFRNVAYAFLILVMVIIGFMILFRAKIDPRTVISIQNAIPRIIITLFLITFSYAIVGLMIDAMYLVLFIGINIVGSSIGGFKSINNVYSSYSGGGLNNLFGTIFAFRDQGINGLATIISGGAYDSIKIILTAVGAIAGLGMMGPWGLLVGGGVGAVAGAGNGLIWVLISLALLFAFFRILVTLISAYVQIIIALIFGPLQIMVGAIPNSNAFGSWFRGLIANLAVFPITSIMLLIGQIISASVNNGQNLWTPPGLGQNIAQGTTGIISFGIALLIPSLANSLKEMLKVKPIAPIGTAIGGAFTQPFGAAQQLMSTVYYAKMLNPSGLLQGLVKKPPAGTPKQGP